MAKSAQIQERHNINKNIKGCKVLPLFAAIPTCVEIAIGAAAMVAANKLSEKKK